MEKELAEELLSALSRIDRPGLFCVSGSAPAVLPGLEVAGLGPIGLPLTAAQAKELMKRCSQAPYGKGEKTVVDTNVRRVWRMEPDRFSLTNPQWKQFIEETVGKVQSELGLENQKLENHLYDLLLYEPGSFFLPHRDGEKLKRMVATLVIVLPSSHEGGEIVVRHDGQEQTIDFSGADNSAFQTHFAAFYADCEHEVRPLRKGYRLCLVYNLTLAKSKETITAPRNSEHVEDITPLLRQWATDASALMLAITLDHQYTKDGLSWDALKGVDRVKAQVLLEAGRQAGCKVYLALLTFWEAGDAEYIGSGSRYGYGRGRGWGDAEDPSQYDMGEIIESSLTADHWTDSEGNGLPIGEMSIDEDVVLDPESLKDVDPEEEFEGYTGNAGMTIEHWYRHGAIFLWPETKHFEVLCDRRSQSILPVLDQMMTRWQEAPPKDAAILKAQCVELATAILAKWEERQYATPTYFQDPKTDDLLKTLAALDEPRLIRDFLGSLMIKDVTIDPGTSLVTVCQTHGWGTFRQELLAIMKATTNETIERNVRLLEQIGAAKPRKKPGWGDLCVSLAHELVVAFEEVDRQPPSTDYRRKKVARAEVLGGLTRALIVTDQLDLLSRVVTHALAKPKLYPLTPALIPALVSLEPWLKKDLKKPSAGLTQWVASCRKQLEALTAQAPQKPTDFRRPAAIDCKCTDCAELKRFLEDPHETVHRFAMRQDRRSHLQNAITNHHCDLAMITETNRNPHVLVCTKTTASYHTKLKTYQQNLEHLEVVRSIEASLPGRPELESSRDLKAASKGGRKRFGKNPGN